MDFTEYAASVDTRVDLSRTADNRYRLWKKAFRPLIPRICSASRILDYGCGGGEFLNFLSRYTKCELVGYEVSKSQKALARQLNQSNPQVFIFDSPDKIRGPFDLVFCHHVIEHVPDPDLSKFVSNLCELASSDGHVVITTPNGLNPLAHTFSMASDRTHLRMHSPFTLAELFQPAGFEIESVFREHPHVYDVPTFFKTLVWSLFAWIFKIGLLAHASGVRGLRYPLTMASSFYVVAKRSGTRLS